MARRSKPKQKVRPLVSFERLEGRDVPAAAFALSGTSLIAFDTNSPTQAAAPVAITGVTAGETLVGIDTRPQNGFLYGLGVNATADTATLYGISTRTGLATAIGTPGQVTFAGTDLPDPATSGYGFDFNPAADRIRVTTSTGLNFRVNPNTGAPTAATPDTALSGGTAAADAAAYTNNEVGVAATTLYLLDAATDKLYTSTNPNGGTTSAVGLPITVGGTAIDFTNVNGFDIGSGVDTLANNTPVLAGVGYAALTVAGTTSLYSIDLTTGVATNVGAVAGAAGDVSGLALQSDVVGLPSIALDAAGANLVRFNTATPGTATTKAITGLTAGETLVGIDYRPATGQLVGLGIDSTADTGTLYVIDTQTGAATVLGTNAASSITLADATGTALPLPDPAATGYGFDFNPTVDRIRVTTSTGLNFRLNPLTGGVVDTAAGTTGNQGDPNVNGLPGGSTGVSGAAYTNSFGGATTTTLYTLDAGSDSLFIQNGTGGPNAGTQTTQVAVTDGTTAIDFSDVNGFDIPSGVGGTTANAVAAGVGYAALTVGGTTSLYSIDLTTGVATNLGAIGTLTGAGGLALGEGSSGTVSFTSSTFTVAEGAGSIDLTLTRTGNTANAATVTVTLTDGTATGGTDFTNTPVTVTFAAGATTATATVPITADTTFEGDETFTATITSPAGGASLGGTPTATVTITDAQTQPTISVADATVAEGNTGSTAALTFTLTLSGASATPVTVLVNTADGTATSPTDYAPLVAQLVTFAPGTTTQTVTVNVVGDGTFEPDETLTLNLSTPVGATLGTPASATGTITNDDAAPTVTIGNVSMMEGNTGVTTFTFTVTLSNASDQPVALLLNTTGGTATAGTDYTPLVASPVTFAPGVTSQTFTVSVVGDTVNEADETFNVNASVVGMPGVSVASGTGTILNDDGSPTLTVGGVALNEGNTGTTAFTFTLTLSAASSVPQVFTVVTAPNTATATDFTPVTQTVTFAPGTTTQTVTVNVLGDTTVEADETFFLNVTPVVSGTPTTPPASVQAVGTILNDDTTTVPPTTGGQLLVGSTRTAIGANSGTPTVRVIAADGTQVSSAAAFGSSFTGGVRTAVADFNNDGVDDVVVGSGPGTASLVRVLDGSTGAELFSVAPFESSFTGGVYVAAGDLNGDGLPELAISPDQGGGPRVDVYSRTAITGTFSKVDSFFGIDDANFRGGARVAIGDVNGDGKGDLVVAAGFQGGPRIAAFDGTTIGTVGGTTGTRVKLFNDFFAFEQTLRNGAYVAVGDIDGDGFGDIIAGGGPGGGPRVFAISGSALISSNGGTLTPLANFFAGDTSNRLGVQIAVKDIDGDSKADLRTVVGGSDAVTTYLGANLSPTAVPTGTTLDGLPDYTGGVYVG